LETVDRELSKKKERTEKRKKNDGNGNRGHDDTDAKRRTTLHLHTLIASLIKLLILTYLS